MQSQFTDKARAALLSAEKTAAGLRQGYVGTEHILAGLLKEGTGVAAKVLVSNGLDEAKLLDMIRDLITPEKGVLAKDRDGYSPRAMKILEDAHRQSERFHADKTGTEHILLALIKEGENVAVRLMSILGVSVQKVYVDTLVAMGEDGALYKEDLAKKQNGRKRGGVSVLEQYSRDRLR